MRALILGSTGMVGSEVLAECLASAQFSQITVVNRDKADLKNKKVTEIVHANFKDFSKIKNKIIGHDVIFYCIGVYTGAVPEATFIEITYDYFEAFVKAVENRKTIFCLFSAVGANPNSTIMFAKWKGKAEEALQKRTFKRIHIFRPGYIHPSNPAKRQKTLFYGFFYYFFPFFNVLFRNMCTTSNELAKAMVRTALQKKGTREKDVIITNKEIRIIGG